MWRSAATGTGRLAPKFSLMADADASYLWSLRTDANGVLYAGGGSPAKVFRFEGSGKPKIVFESTDLLVQSIAFDGKGALYVATSPDGKVYKVSVSGEKSVFFDPKAKYIWDLAFGKDGTLYVATGDKGRVYSVASDGKSELFYASDEAHIKVLGFDGKGNLLAGTEPNGRILRVTRNAERAGKRKTAEESIADGFVIYETSKREVTSIGCGGDGWSIYAGGDRGEEPAGNGGAVGRDDDFFKAGRRRLQMLRPVEWRRAACRFWRFRRRFPAASTGLPRMGRRKRFGVRGTRLWHTLGLNSDGRLLVGTVMARALLVIDGRGVYAQLGVSGTSQIMGDFARTEMAGRYLRHGEFRGKFFRWDPSA